MTPRPWSAWYSLALGLALSLTGNLPAAAPPTVEPWHREVERLIADLGSRDYRIREAAEEQLGAESPRILPLIRRALGHPEPEVRRRALRLFDRHESARLFATRTVTLEVTGKTMPNVIAELQKATGYKIMLFGAVQAPGGVGGEPTFTYKFQDTPFWDVIERLCRDASLTVQPSYGDDMLRLQPGAGYAAHATREGPFRLVPNNFSLYRNVELGLVNPRGGATTSRTENLTFAFTLFGEPRLPILSAGEPRVEAAYDSEKNTMLPPRGGPPEMVNGFGGRMWVSRRHYGGGNKQMSLQVSVPLTRQSEKATTLSVIRGVVPVTVLVEQKPLVVTDKILAAKGQKIVTGDTQFSFEDVQKLANGQYQVRMTITNNQQTDPGDYTWMNSLYNRIELQDDKGARFQNFGNSWGGNGVNSVQMTMTYGPAGGLKAGEPTRFVYTHWVTRVHDVPFEFKNLPLP